MELRLKSDIKDERIKKIPDDSDYMKGFWSDVGKIENNKDFLEEYRFVQFFKLPISEDMKFYASIPNYAPKSLLENMRLTGEDLYFTECKKIFENPDNCYSTKVIFSPLDDMLNSLAILDRADLTQIFIDKGCTPQDIYCNTRNANATLEICKVMIDFGYRASDDIITWYLMHGMGNIGKICINDCTDLDYVTETECCDLDSFEIISKHNFPDGIPIQNAMNIIYYILSSELEDVDVALFLKLYSIVSHTLTRNEKLSFLGQILTKGDKYLIYKFLLLLESEGFDNQILENQIFRISKSAIGYQIFKLEIEGDTNHDVIMDYCYEIERDGKIDYYVNDENGFISEMNEKYISDSSDTDSYYSSDSDESDF